MGIVLISPSGEIITQEIKTYPITNDESAYEVVVAGLDLAKDMGMDQIEIKSDS